MWFQGTKWEHLRASDFLTVMPIPKFNNLEEKLVLDDEHLSYMNTKAAEIVSMWIDCENFGYKPSDFRENNQIYQEDLKCFEMLHEMQKDARKYMEAKKKKEQENKNYIAEQQKKFRQSKGLRY